MLRSSFYYRLLVGFGGCTIVKILDSQSRLYVGVVPKEPRTVVMLSSICVGLKFWESDGIKELMREFQFYQLIMVSIIMAF